MVHHAFCTEYILSHNHIYIFLRHVNSKDVLVSFQMTHTFKAGHYTNYISSSFNDACRADDPPNREPENQHNPPSYRINSSVSLADCDVGLSEYKVYVKTRPTTIPRSSVCGARIEISARVLIA